MASHNVRRGATQGRTSLQRQEEVLKIDEYRSLVDLVHLKSAERQYSSQLLGLTSKLLATNPEFYTIWNIRKRCLFNSRTSESSNLPLLSDSLSETSQTCIIQEVAKSASSTSRSSETSDPISHSLEEDETTLEVIQSDLNFLIPLLLKWSKCYWIWNHRAWLFQQAALRLEATVVRNLWQEELDFVEKILVTDSRNFHAWSYRRIVVAHLESPALNGQSMLESEFAYTTRMISANLSNFSAWHNRSKLIPKLLDQRNANDAARREFLNNEFEMITHALWTDPDAQSLWFYYQFLMTDLIGNASQLSIVPSLTRGERIEWLDRQLIELRNLLHEEEGCKWIYSSLIEYATALWEIVGRVPSDEERRDLKAWLAHVKKLDPLRSGRWLDMEKTLPFREKLIPVLTNDL